MNRTKLLKRAINRLENRLEKFNQTSNRLSWLRLAIILFGVMVSVLALFFSNDLLGGLAIFIFLVIFSFASFIHRQFKHSIRKYKLWQSIKIEQLNRATLNWKEIPSKHYNMDSHHPFAIDLDIIGEHSLHRLIDNTTSVNGSERILGWLLNENPNPTVTIERQKLVAELVPINRFRDKLTLQSLLISGESFDGHKFLNWLNKLSEKAPSRLFIYALIGFAIINIILYVLNLIGLVPPYYIMSFIFYVLLFISKSKFINNIFWETIALNDEIRKISRTLLYLEKYPLPADSLIAKLLKPIRQHGEKPSTYLRRLLILLSLFGFRANIIIQILMNIVLPVDYLLAGLFISYKDKIKTKIPVWLDCWYELEALIALANFAWLNPEYTFPRLNIGKNNFDQLLKSKGLGHPLINKDVKHLNDFLIHKTGDIILITGSNMSGKSTFLRTVGINICLAQAGSVVNADSMNTNFMRVFTCIKINDDLSEGLSYFYAEVKRLRQLLDQLNTKNDYPLLYLIDEIYKGTNNQERLIGSRAYIKSLGSNYGAGIVSTHDLELTGLESELESLKNFHFQEHIENDKMIFDFKLRSGPCPTTNALVIMLNEGLPTD